MFEQATQLLGNVNVGQAANVAQQHIGGNAGGGDKGMLQNIMSNVMGGTDKPSSADQSEVDYATSMFDKIYGQNQKSSSANDLGSAAAMKAFKLFAGGGSGSGGGTDKLAGLAMGEAMKLFTSNNAGGAQKSDIISKAVSWAIKLFLTKQQGSSNPAFGALMSMVGGGNAAQDATAGSTAKKSNIASSIINKFF